MSQFTIDVIELAIEQGRVVTPSTAFNLAIAESSINKRVLNKESYDAAAMFEASKHPHLLDEWVRVCYANENSLEKDLVEVCRRIYPESYSTKAFAKAYKVALSFGFSDREKRATQKQTLENLVTETYELLEKEKA